MIDERFNSFSRFVHRNEERIPEEEQNDDDDDDDDEFDHQAGACGCACMATQSAHVFQIKNSR